MKRVVAEVLGEDGFEAGKPPTDRDRKEAERIAGRAIRQFHDGNLATAVKGGPLGIFSTVHSARVYGLVAERLREMPDETEISVVRISGTSAAQGTGSIEVTYADVISAKSMGGFTKYPSPNPSANPEAFVGGSLSFGAIPCAPPFRLELIHPQPQVEPATP